MIDLDKLHNIELDGVFFWDYPDFCDAYIGYAEIDGVPLTEEELNEVNENSQFVYEQVIKKLY
jgi:hypothetical protein